MDARSDRKQQALAILGEADTALNGWTCDASTACCRFAVTGREPWVTQVEWELVVEELKRGGRRLPAVPPDADGRCPFLDGTGRCVVYAARPLGCRTFFCERAQSPGPMPRAALRGLPRRLEELTVTERGRDTGARPIRSWLTSAHAPARAPPRATARSRAR